MLDQLTELIGNQCREATQYGIFGTQDFHIESVSRLEDKNGSLNFLVTTWNGQSAESRQDKEMSLFELMDLLGRVMGHRALRESVGLFKD